MSEAPPNLDVQNGDDLFSLLADDIMIHILQYVPDARDLLACEKSCPTLKELLSYDEVWKYCGGAATEMVVELSYRSKACIKPVLNDIKLEQRSTHNRLVDVLSMESVQRLMDRLRASWAYVPGNHLHYYFRGDSLACALDIIEAYIVKRLQKALRISMRRADEYPTVELADLQLVDNIRGDVSPSLNILLGQIDEHDEDTRAMFSSIWDRAIQFQLARRLASRAGIVIITNEAMMEISNHIFSVLMILLERPMLVLAPMLGYLSRVVFLEEDTIDLWNDIPPTTITRSTQRSLSGEESVTCDYHVVIIPRLIVDSAAFLGLPVVYGLYGHNCSWVLETGQTMEEAVRAAKERYMVQADPPGGENELDSSDGSSIESMSIESESSEDDFVYYKERFWIPRLV